MGSQDTAAPGSWSRYRDQTWSCNSIVLSLSCELNFWLRSTDVHYRRSGYYLLAQREVHVDLSLHLDRLSIEEGRLVHPLFHRFHRGGDQQRVAADQFQILNGAIGRNHGSQMH